MNFKYNFTLGLTLTLQVLMTLRERERGREKENIFCPKKCPKRNLLKTKFLSMEKTRSKVPLSARNESKELKKVMFVMFLVNFSTFYHVWADESELGL